MSLILKNYYRNGTQWGQIFEHPKFTVFFGNRFCCLTKIKRFFPQYHFCSLNQVHGSDFKNAILSSTQLKADGHFTNNRKVGLLVKTADCVPVFLYNQKTVIALHCGWRSLAKELLIKATTHFKGNNFSIFLGPHITKKNFEVSTDLKNTFELWNKFPDSPLFFKSLSSEKMFVDLSTLIKNQLAAQNLYPCHWIESEIDTVSDLHYNSYRRDRRPGRQWSFIALK